MVRFEELNAITEWIVLIDDGHSHLIFDVSSHNVESRRRHAVLQQVVLVHHRLLDSLLVLTQVRVILHYLEEPPAVLVKSARMHWHVVGATR